MTEPAPQYQAELYAQHRPQYPEELYEKVFEYCGNDPRSLAVDLGTGETPKHLHAAYCRFVLSLQDLGGTSLSDDHCRSAQAQGKLLSFWHMTTAGKH